MVAPIYQYSVYILYSDYVMLSYKMCLFSLVVYVRTNHKLVCVQSDEFCV